jgi:hypothetical protein
VKVLRVLSCALLCAGCTSAKGFERACRSLTPGTAFDDADSALTNAGGRHWKAATGEDYWSRKQAFSTRIGDCVTRFDDERRLVSVEYREHDDLL